MYKDETNHISNFLVRNLIVVLQWGNKGGEGEGEVGKNIIHYMYIFRLLPVWMKLKKEAKQVNQKLFAF